MIFYLCRKIWSLYNKKKNKYFFFCCCCDDDVSRRTDRTLLTWYVYQQVTFSLLRSSAKSTKNMLKKSVCDLFLCAQSLQALLVVRKCVYFLAFCVFSILSLVVLSKISRFLFLSYSLSKPSFIFSLSACLFVFVHFIAQSYVVCCTTERTECYVQQREVHYNSVKRTFV